MSAKSVDLELRISYFLRYGVIVSGLLMLVGWLMHLNTGSNPFAEYATYHAEGLAPVLSTAFKNADIVTIMAYAGLFCLISLPIIRVLLTALLFLKEQDFVMAACSIFVFSALILSFALGMNIG